MKLRHAIMCMLGGLFCGLVIVSVEQGKPKATTTPGRAFTGRSSTAPNRLKISMKASVHSPHTTSITLPRRPQISVDSPHTTLVTLPRRPQISGTAEDDLPEDPAENGFQNPTSILELVNAKAVGDHMPKKMNVRT